VEPGLGPRRSGRHGSADPRPPATGVAPAIANAVYHATGRRIRDLPIRPEMVI